MLYLQRINHPATHFWTVVFPDSSIGTLSEKDRKKLIFNIQNQWCLTLSKIYSHHAETRTCCTSSAVQRIFHYFHKR